MLLFFAIASLLCFMENAHASFTFEDEKRLGKEFYDDIKGKHLLLEDKRTSDFINGIGQRLLEQGKYFPLDFTFSVIKSSGINAFATPGGYVYVYSGLIELTESESQLAGVLAHEIAHVKSRHIAQMIEKTKKMNIATLAAMLAGAFLGSEGFAAVSSLAMATATTLNLKYSREHEEEADRLGMSYLVNARYNGKAMLDFLKIMRQYEFYSDSIPSYFMTHPGTNDRIRYLTLLLQTRYTMKGSKYIVGGFDRIRTMLILANNTLQANFKYFDAILKKDPDNLEALYGLAVTESRMGQIDAAGLHFARALQFAPNDADILRDLGICYFQIGDIPNAITTLKKAYGINSHDRYIAFNLGRSYETAGDFHTALELYKQIQKDNPQDREIFYNLAMVYGKTADMGESHYSFGIYFKYKGKRKSARFHFKTALEYYSPNSGRWKEIQQELDKLNATPEKQKVKDGHKTPK